MQTTIRPPIVVPALDVPPPRRRWPWIVLAEIVLASAAFLAWVMNEEPLARGSSVLSVSDPRVDVTVRHVDAFGSTGMINTVPIQRGTVFRYTITIRNDGRVPITILDAGWPSDEMLPRHVVAMKPDLYADGGRVDTGFVAFEPFELRPGVEAGLRMEVRVTEEACYDPGGSASWFSEPITYRILGITRHSDVETGLELRLRGTRDTSC
jgi:hypothetical protein